MEPIILVVFREALEACIIISVMLALVGKIQLQGGKRAILFGVLGALIATFALLFASSVGLSFLKELLLGKNWETIEGVMMIVSAFFITYVVFWLHAHFVKAKAQLLFKAHKAVEDKTLRSIALLTGLLVSREGVEIVIIISPLIVSKSILSLFTASLIGIVGAIIISLLVFSTHRIISLSHVLRINTLLLVLFAGGLLLSGFHELIEQTTLLETINEFKLYLAFLPSADSFGALLIKSLFGWKQTIGAFEAAIYATYLTIMAYKLNIPEARKSQIAFSNADDI